MKEKSIWIVKAFDNSMQHSEERFSYAFESQNDASECVEAGRNKMPNLSWWAEYTRMNDKEYALHLIDLMFEES
jgi:hypothetical protein